MSVITLKVCTYVLAEPNQVEGRGRLDRTLLEASQHERRVVRVGLDVPCPLPHPQPQRPSLQHRVVNLIYLRFKFPLLQIWFQYIIEWMSQLILKQ